MKRDLFLLFLILYFVHLILGDVSVFLGTADKAEFLDHFFSLHNLWLEVSFTLSYIGYGLFTYLVLNKYHPSAPKKYILFIGLGMIAAVVLRYFLEEYVALFVVGSGNYRDGIGLWYYLFDNFLYAFLYTSVAMVYFFVKYSFRKEQEKLELIVENKATQLQLLKSQINPHFLFNNLNSIYSLVNKKSDKALTAIDKLSNLLRYSLYEVDEKVMIQQEMNHIEDFIALQKLRTDQELKYDICVKNIDQKIKVPPFLFFPLVENAFKHGDQHHADYPIQIKLGMEGKQISFSTSNKLSNLEKDEVGGIGLINIQKRLALLFGEEHSFIISQDDDIFNTDLKIPNNHNQA